MIDSFNWSINFTLESITRLSLILLILAPYIYTVYLDLRYKEMEYWTILMSSFINIIFIFIPVFIWGNTSFGWNLLYIIIMFTILSLLNGRANKENILGKADVDLFISQILITGSLLLFIYQSSTNNMVAMLNIGVIVEFIFTSIVVGLLMTILIWIIKVIHIKIKSKDKLIKVIKNNKEVPTLIAFIPWIIVNAYLIMGV